MGTPEILAEKPQRAAHRKRGHATEAAQRAVEHRVAELVEQREIGRTLAVARLQYPIDQFDSARRTDAAWRALAARLDRAELERISRHARHVDGVVEDDHAAV